MARTHLTAPAGVALAEAVAFLQGVRNAVDPSLAATIIAEQLARRVFSVQPVSGPILYDLLPETRQRVRRALGASLTEVGREAGMLPRTVGDAESGETRPQSKTLLAIGDALVPLGAKRPTAET